MTKMYHTSQVSLTLTLGLHLQNLNVTAVHLSADPSLYWVGSPGGCGCQNSKPEESWPTPLSAEGAHVLCLNSPVVFKCPNWSRLISSPKLLPLFDPLTLSSTPNPAVLEREEEACF